jgi:hypothetical protein
MTLLSRALGVVVIAFLHGLSGQAQALEMLQFIDATDHARVIADASGLKLTDDGVIYVTSQEKGTILRIVDGKIEANSLTPSVFRDSDLGGTEVLANGNLVVINEGSGRVAILTPGLKPITQTRSRSLHQSIIIFMSVT